MKRTLALASAFSMIAFSAFAEETAWTLKFEGPDAPALTVTFKKDGTSVDDKGVAGKYSYDEATKKICDTLGKGGCVVLGAKLNKVGDSTSFRTDAGKTGTATMVSAE